jgi:hypothetical protein
MSSGLDKQTRQQEKRRAAKVVPPLDPEFPYRDVAFDAWVFGVQIDGAQQLEAAKQS